MVDNFSLTDAEKSAVRMATSDGLWEILLGITLISFVASDLLREILGVPLNYLPVLLVMVIGIPAMQYAKKTLITPRVGHVEFRSQRRAEFRFVKYFLAALVILTLSLWLIPMFSRSLSGESDLPYWFVDAAVGFLLFLFFIVLSNATESPRLIVYGFLMGLSLPADVILEESWGINFPVFTLIAGLVMTVWGSATLIRFLNKYQPPDEMMLADLEGKMIDYVPLDVNIGSIAIQRFIQNRQPLLTLHGHVHEASTLSGSWRDRIGKTDMFTAAYDGPELALIRFDPGNLAAAKRDLL